MSLSSYSTIDDNPYFGISYYRLKQTDFDGKFKYSGIKSVRVEKTENSKIKIYPNPSNNIITIIADASELELIKIFNDLGQDVTPYTKIAVNTEEGVVVIDISKLNIGMYYIKTRTSSNKVYKH